MTYCEDDPKLFDRNLESTQEFLRTMAAFQAFYAPLHGYICVVLCVFGFSSNFIHVIVLTRQSMRGSAVNSIMTAVALCDMGTMASYLIYICHFVLKGKSATNCSNGLTYLSMSFLLFHMFLSITLHTTTLWLAVAMAFLRRMTLHTTVLHSQWQRSRLAKKISLVVFFTVMLFSLPTLLVHRIVEYEADVWRPKPSCVQFYEANYSETIFTMAIAPAAMQNGCMWFKANLWLTGTLFKVIPCVLLIVLISSLLLKLKNAEQKRRLLLLNGGVGNDTNKRITSDKTTVMLLAILGVFLITEFPQGILSILSAVYTNDVHNLIYFMLGDVLDLLSLMNSSVNFVLYCLMSSRYRHTFCKTVLPLAWFRCCRRRQTRPNVALFTNTDLPSRIQNVEVCLTPDGRRRSSPAFRTVREPLLSQVRLPLSARASRT
ncbi:unnamed protein product [Bursaphelenchus okinawaensis]|uniref:G-protein coupled receptors family 1 profile domain-containing protein n=1 Tax=Bursaphelenchus okinawaensis TaxID=465554 RepID=A0A811L3I9_9BILA|nr:unnamed protein product [Bursaphelenchus okinawaensis]CAG9118451.1 unnamed protein product [Bursaphelenchus okinawaensis]